MPDRSQQISQTSDVRRASISEGQIRSAELLQQRPQGSYSKSVLFAGLLKSRTADRHRRSPTSEHVAMPQFW